jgi:hypothetical protein
LLDYLRTSLAPPSVTHVSSPPPIFGGFASRRRGSRRFSAPPVRAGIRKRLAQITTIQPTLPGET